jgi:predicted DNA-binding protein (MmcQ/YjbR family)
VTRNKVLKICASLPGAIEDYPFGDEVAVFKVGGRMFALVTLDGEQGIVNLKCEPELAEVLRVKYESVRPGYHMNKRHWNSVDIDNSLPDREWRDMVEHSYQLVVNGLPRGERNHLGR